MRRRSFSETTLQCQNNMYGESAPRHHGFSCSPPPSVLLLGVPPPPRVFLTFTMVIPATASLLLPVRVALPPALPMRALPPPTARRAPATAGGRRSLLPCRAPTTTATPRQFRVPPLKCPSSCVCLSRPFLLGFRGPAACPANEAHQRHVRSMAQEIFTAPGSNFSTAMGFWVQAGNMGQLQDELSTLWIRRGNAARSLSPAQRGPAIAGES